MITQTESNRYVGLSTDTKPAFAKNGDVLFLMDTDKTYYFNEEAHGWFNGTDTNLVSIAISTPPSKTTYADTESFDATGMVVTATYSDDSTGTVTDLTFEGISYPLKVGETTVTVVYCEGGVRKTATQAITVNAFNLSSISVKTGATGGYTYTEGEKFDPAGTVITATFNDGTTQDVEWGDENLTFAPTTALVTTDKKITYTYVWGETTKTVQKNLTVNAAETGS